MNPKISVIVPIYGVEKYIEKCARSVFEQTYTDLEIIFVDDCTPDNSISILKRVLEEYPQMKAKTRILSYEKNKGVAGARQTGLEAACGEYTIQFDPDDYVDRNMIEQLVAKAEEEDADIVICDFNMIQNGKETHVHVNPSLNPIDCMKQVLTGEVHGSLANKLIRRSLYTENNIAFTQGLNMMEDLSVMYRLLYFARKLAYVPQPFYNYALRSGSISASKMNPMQQKNSQDLIMHMNEFCAHEQIIDNGIIEAFNMFKARVKCLILLYGNIYGLDNSLYEDVKFYHILRNKYLSYALQIMGGVSLLHSRLMVCTVRKFADISFKCRSWIS